LVQLKPCTIGLEACGGAHYWHREISRLGHTQWLLPAHKVKPHVDGNKNNRHDAAAICARPKATTWPRSHWPTKYARVAWAMLRYGEDYCALRAHRQTPHRRAHRWASEKMLAGAVQSAHPGRQSNGFDRRHR
jgi:transposase